MIDMPVCCLSKVFKGQKCRRVCCHSILIQECGKFSREQWQLCISKPYRTIEHVLQTEWENLLINMEDRNTKPTFVYIINY